MPVRTWLDLADDAHGLGDPYTTSWTQIGWEPQDPFDPEVVENMSEGGDDDDDDDDDDESGDEGDNKLTSKSSHSTEIC